MNLKAELLKEHSYENSEKIAWFIMDNQNYLSELFQLFWENDKLIVKPVRIIKIKNFLIFLSDANLQKYIIFGYQE